MTFTDLYPISKKVKSIDFEKDFDLTDEKYDFAFVINTLEHIYNYQNFINNINISLVKGGKLEGAIPFLHPYHKDPDDYFRYTHTALKRILEKAIWGMLPKGSLGRQYYKRLFIYSDNKINYKKTANNDIHEIPMNLAESNNWIKVEV